MGVPASKISVIPHGILEYPYEPQPTPDTTESADQQILFFGTIKEYKGVDILLEAFAALPAEIRSKTTLSIAGSPQIDTEPLKEQAQTLGIASSIEWDLRFIPDREIPTLFDRADVVALPYREIDQSGALLTALNYHKPIVATNVGGFGELLEHEVHALLTEPEAPTSFATQLERALSEDTIVRELRANMQELTESTLSWSQIGEQTRNVYEHLTNQ